MNLKGISYYLGIFCYPITCLAILNILYSSYFDYFLNTDSYIFTMIASFSLGSFFYFLGKNSDKNVNFYEQISIIILNYFIISILIGLPYYLSNYQITFINALFEAVSGITGTGFTIFENIKYLDPTLILWRSSTQWIGGMYFLIYLMLFFSSSKFNYKLQNLIFTSDKSINPEINIKKISTNIFIYYSLITILLFFIFSSSNVRLFDSLNIAMTIISSGGFLPTNSLSQIIKTNIQEIILCIAFLFSALNIFFFANLFKRNNIIADHSEDFLIIFTVFIATITLFFLINDLSFLETLINILSSISTSGITTNKLSGNYSLFFLFLTIVGGSLMSNTSGVKILRFYILLKASFLEIFKLVKPNNIVNQNILYSNNKINNETVKLSFFIFISFFISIFFLSSLLLFDSINFENSFKLSILTLTNTVNNGIYGLTDINFSNLLTYSKILIIIFMIIGKIELLSLLLIIRKLFFKN